MFPLTVNKEAMLMTVHFLVSHGRHARVCPREAVNVGISLYLLNHKLTLMETDYHYDYGNDDNDKLACCMFRRTKEGPSPQEEKT